MRAVDLSEVPYTVERLWVTGVHGHRLYAQVVVGTLGDGRAFAARSGVMWRGAWTARDEQQAVEAAEKWMLRRGGVWREVPALK